MNAKKYALKKDKVTTKNLKTTLTSSEWNLCHKIDEL